MAQTVIGAMPRRTQVETSLEKPFGPTRVPRPALPRIGLLRTAERLASWIAALVRFQLGNLWDLARGRDSEERRAVRLRLSFERVGGTFVKIGQQMASRIDLLPLRYCQELAGMLDQFPPFPTEEAIAVIERATHRRLEEVFSEFDPEPIGSASLACVYQARLRSTGEKVAVKVRRPGIGELFEADFRVMDALCVLAEALTLVRPGFTENIRAEFRASLGSELDFSREGRQGELFRRRARRDRQRFFTAPRVHREFSHPELLVQEFVSGMWMAELLAAVEGRAPAALARMRELNIDPRLVARRLLRANYWGMFSHIAFHADPHPANILVRSNSRLVFVDFGASGHVSSSRRTIYKKFFASFVAQDPAAMAQTSIMLAEPLPPMDLNAIVKEVEAAYHAQMIAIKSRQSPWYERTSASIFITTVDIMTKHRVPAPQDILMFARAGLLYDTLAARLDSGINYFREFRRFAGQAGGKAGERTRAAVGRRLRRGLLGSDHEVIQEVVATGEDLVFRATRLLSAPYDFAVVPYMVEKGVFTVMTLLRLVARVALVSAAAAFLVAAARAWSGQPVTAGATLEDVTASKAFLAVAMLLTLVHVRVIAFRLGDKTRPG